MPFCPRWIFKHLGHEVRDVLEYFAEEEIVEDYPPLVEISKGLVC